MTTSLLLPVLLLIPFKKSVDLSQYKEIRLEVEVGAFELTVLPVPGKVLYLEGEYDPDLTDSITVSLKKEDGRALLNISSLTRKNLNLKRLKPDQVLTLKLPEEVAYEIDLSFGLIEGQVELGGLSIRKGTLSFGAGDVELSFSEPNPGVMDSFSVSCGLSNLQWNQVGNARVLNVKISSGLGRVGLDLSGQWKEDAEIAISSGLQALEIKVPAELGVFLEIDGLLNLKDLENMERATGGYLSKNFDSAQNRVHVVLSGALNALDLDWINWEEGN